MTEEKEIENLIIAAESGPKNADRKNTYHVGNCQDCNMEIYFFGTEKYVNCYQCGAWTKKPVNGKAMTI